MRNALRAKTYQELTTLVHSVSVRALVITGAGSSFCSGDDVRELMNGGAAATAPTAEPALTPAAEALLHPPLAVAALKRGLRRALDPDWTALGSWVTATLYELFDTDDHREGVASFLEKRQPHYVGR